MRDLVLAFALAASALSAQANVRSGAAAAPQALAPAPATTAVRPEERSQDARIVTPVRSSQILVSRLDPPVRSDAGPGLSAQAPAGPSDGAGMGAGALSVAALIAWIALRRR